MIAFHTIAEPDTGCLPVDNAIYWIEFANDQRGVGELPDPVKKNSLAIYYKIVLFYSNVDRFVITFYLTEID